jgi:hypothetical protein
LVLSAIHAKKVPRARARSVEGRAYEKVVRNSSGIPGKLAKLSKLPYVNSNGMPGRAAALKAAYRINIRGGMARRKRNANRVENPTIGINANQPSRVNREAVEIG